MHRVAQQLAAPWTALALMLVAIVAPTAGVLWFMLRAVDNERLAVRQRLTEVYGDQARDGARAFESRIRERFEAAPTGLPPALLFREWVVSGVCDSCLVIDGDENMPRVVVIESPPDAPNLPMARARDLEYARHDPVGAAKHYAAIASSVSDAATRASALVSQARCLAKSGETTDAVSVYLTVGYDAAFRAVRDESGRSVTVAALLRALELMDSQRDTRFNEALAEMCDAVLDYSGPPIPSEQRLFLISRLRDMDTAGQLADRHDEMARLAEAERLAEEYRAVDAPRIESPGMVPSGIAHVYQLRHPLPDGRVVIALVTEESLVAEAGEFWAARLGESVRGRLQPTGQNIDDAIAVVRTPAGPLLPDWEHALTLAGEDPFQAAAVRRVGAYLWTGGLFVVLVGVLSVLVVRLMVRQMAVTRLKNELIATVTHELKTPLASMRVLVDTLIDGRCADPNQEREYLGLIARENTRLSHLIDNFLTFSRMERNKRVFDQATLNPKDIVAIAVDSVRERFESPHCSLEVEVEGDLPSVVGDRDALVSVLLNLLDNAYKYTERDKKVRLRAYQSDGMVCFDVEDNGVGLSQRAARKVFDRFYQVDQTLSRRTGGCGLGLSIVRFIVTAHGGTVGVDSTPGKGSTFTVRLSAVNGAGEDS